MTHKKHRKGADKQKAPAGPAAKGPAAAAGTPDSPPSLLSAARSAEEAMAAIRRLMEGQEFASIEEANEFLENLLASGGEMLPSVAPATDVERAQDVMYEAWGANNRKKRIDLAKYALEISPDCADAYVLLAQETAKNPYERARLYEQGVQAGERALGKEFFDEEAGNFWGLIETRPYMRARLGLASALWGIAERRAAIEHAYELLRLNPGDNQGVRYVLLEWLLAEGRNDEAGALLESYEDDASAGWMYARAIHGLRTEGRSARVDELLREALEENPHVPSYLLSEKAIPEQLPATVQLGGESEAMEYVEAGYGTWYFTPGALEWLREVWGSEGVRSRRATRDRPTGPAMP
jgi:tetratricopeptide (TPR) repeat protein